MILIYDFDAGMSAVLNFPKSLFSSTFDLDASYLYSDFMITLEMSGLIFPVIKH